MSARSGFINFFRSYLRLGVLERGQAAGVASVKTLQPSRNRTSQDQRQVRAENILAQIALIEDFGLFGRPGLKRQSGVEIAVGYDDLPPVQGGLNNSFNVMQPVLMEVLDLGGARQASRLCRGPQPSPPRRGVRRLLGGQRMERRKRFCEPLDQSAFARSVDPIDRNEHSLVPANSEAQRARTARQRHVEKSWVCLNDNGRQLIWLITKCRRLAPSLPSMPNCSTGSPANSGNSTGAVFGASTTSVPSRCPFSIGAGMGPS